MKKNKKPNSSQFSKFLVYDNATKIFQKLINIHYYENILNNYSFNSEEDIFTFKSFIYKKFEYQNYVLKTFINTNIITLQTKALKETKTLFELNDTFNDYFYEFFFLTFFSVANYSFEKKHRVINDDDLLFFNTKNPLYQYIDIDNNYGNFKFNNWLIIPELEIKLNEETYEEFQISFNK